MTDVEQKPAETEEKENQSGKKPIGERLSRAAWVYALSIVDKTRQEVETETGLPGSQINKMLSGHNPECWATLGEYFKKLGHEVPNLDVLSLPSELSLENANIEQRKLLVAVLKADLDKDGVTTIQAMLDELQAAAAAKDAGDEETAADAE